MQNDQQFMIRRRKQQQTQRLVTREILCWFFFLFSSRRVNVNDVSLCKTLKVLKRKFSLSEFAETSWRPHGNFEALEHLWSYLRFFCTISIWVRWKIDKHKQICLVFTLYSHYNTRKNSRNHFLSAYLCDLIVLRYFLWITTLYFWAF